MQLPICSRYADAYSISFDLHNIEMHFNRTMWDDRKKGIRNNNNNSIVNWSKEFNFYTCVFHSNPLHSISMCISRTMIFQWCTLSHLTFYSQSMKPSFYAAAAAAPHALFYFLSATNEIPQWSESFDLFFISVFLLCIISFITFFSLFLLFVCFCMRSIAFRWTGLEISWSN